MKPMQHVALNRMQGALDLASRAAEDTRDDDAISRASSEPWYTATTCPSAADAEYAELQRQGHQCQRGAIMVPLHRFWFIAT